MQHRKLFLSFTILLVISSCGGGGGGGGGNSSTPPVPTITITARTKELLFSWGAVGNATHFRLLEDPDGQSGHSIVIDNIDASATQVAYRIAAHKYDVANATYIFEACNGSACKRSSPFNVGELIPQTIGYMKAPNWEEGDWFGYSVGVSGDGNTIAVSAVGEDSMAIGVGGDGNDNSFHNPGAAYVYYNDGGGWAPQAYIKPSNTDSNDGFGVSLALSTDGNTLVVGARLEDSGATGVNGDESDNSVSASGACYVFRFDGAIWVQEAYVKASNPDQSDHFGDSVAVSGDGNVLVVATYREDSNSTGINGPGDDNGAPSSGAAYVYRYDGSMWRQDAYIKSSNSEESDLFGQSVAISEDGNTIVVGAYGEDSSATGIDGDESDNSVPYAGAAYVFRYDGMDWSQQAYVKASNTGPDYFGASIALSASGNVLVVGALYEDSAATGVNGDGFDDSVVASGAAYVYAFDGTAWSQKAYLKASNTDRQDSFGRSVAISGDGRFVAIGATGESGKSSGINGDQETESDRSTGAVYVFASDSGSWSQIAYVKAINNFPWTDDRFGVSLALDASGDMLVVGAYEEDCEPHGLTSPVVDCTHVDTGAVYIH